MRKFKLEQSVWIHQGKDDPRVPGVVKAFAKNPPLSGGFDHYEVAIDGTSHTLTFSEPELSARGVIERIGGLKSLREHMQNEEELADSAAFQADMGPTDDELTPDQLREKYDTEDGWGDHPLHKMRDWRYEVNSQYTRMGYWEWVSYKLNE